mmetsp:Transcript_24296/g.52438  ORF Transcript_24296/g.52438 Transcript_24296/m.52438 type:complete len:202 (+) Transcript_24296:557-1162(+)
MPSHEPSECSGALTREPRKKPCSRDPGVQLKSPMSTTFAPLASPPWLVEARACAARWISCCICHSFTSPRLGFQRMCVLPTTRSRPEWSSVRCSSSPTLSLRALSAISPLSPIARSRYSMYSVRLRASRLLRKKRATPSVCVPVRFLKTPSKPAEASAGAKTESNLSTSWRASTSARRWTMCASNASVRFRSSSASCEQSL